MPQEPLPGRTAFRWHAPRIAPAPAVNGWRFSLVAKKSPCEHTVDAPAPER
jgi:hypothetical protein